MYIILLGILYQDNWVIERPTTCRYSRWFVSFQKWTWSSFRIYIILLLQNACIWFLLSYYYIGVTFLPFIQVCNFKEVFNYGQPHLIPCRVPIYFCLWLITRHCFVLLFHLVTSINLHQGKAFIVSFVLYFLALYEPFNWCKVYRSRTRTSPRSTTYNYKVNVKELPPTVIIIVIIIMSLFIW